VADGQDNKQYRRELDRSRRLIQALREAGEFDDDPEFYADLLRMMDEAIQQLERGIRSDEVPKGNLLKKRLENEFGDLDDLENDLEKGEETGKEGLEEKPEEGPEDEDSESPRRRRRRRKKKEPREKEPTKGKAKPQPKAGPKAPTSTLAGGGAAGRGGLAVRGAAVAGGGAAAGPVILIIIIIVLVILIIIGVLWLIFAGGRGKVVHEAGGSAALQLDCNSEYDRQLVDGVKRWLSQPLLEPRLVVAGSDADLSWKEEGTDACYHKLDKRVMETLRYLLNDEDDSEHPGRGWSRIGIRLLTNGPDQTRRDFMGEEERYQDTPIAAESAYALGQAIAIDQLGHTSLALTTALCNPAFVPTAVRDPYCMPIQPHPVRIDWQLTVADYKIRILYDQMQHDAKEVYNALVRFRGQAESGSDVMIARLAEEFMKIKDDENAADENEYAKAMFGLDILNQNLLSATVTPGVSLTTIRYFTTARNKLNAAKKNLEDALAESAEAFIREWGEYTSTGGEENSSRGQTPELIREGLKFTFRGMQVANMPAWKGNVTFGVKYWKAYEARMNIRQLVADIMRMPVILAEEGSNFNADMVVKQMIVFSPEDDLDNGLPDLDVFPSTMLVLAGGVGFDGLEDGDELFVGDGQVDLKDLHFSSLPIDNGIFSKVCTEFIYKPDRLIEKALVLDIFRDLSVDPMESLLCNKMYYRQTNQVASDESEEPEDIEGGMIEEGEDNEGSELVQSGDEWAWKVSYRQFVHIAF